MGGPDATDSVFFRSTAKLEFIEGKTDNIIGSIQFAPDLIDSGVTGTLQVDLRTLKTGIDMRDRHMRERHLKTDEYPYAYFELKEVAGLPSTPIPESTYAATVSGLFYIHGVKRKLTSDASIQFHGSPAIDYVDIGAHFSIHLEDYEIPRPKALFMKLAETIEINLQFAARRGGPHPAPQLPDWSQVDQ